MLEFDSQGLTEFWTIKAKRLWLTCSQSSTHGVSEFAFRDLLGSESPHCRLLAVGIVNVTILKYSVTSYFGSPNPYPGTPCI